MKTKPPAVLHFISWPSSPAWRRVRPCSSRWVSNASNYCYDDASFESFWGNLKNKMVHQRFETRVHAESAIREYIGIFAIADDGIPGLVIRLPLGLQLLQEFGS